MAELTITDASLKPIADKVLAGERLSFDDGIALYRSPDLLAVGWLANHVREKRHGNVTLLQRQPPHQSHQRLRRALQAVRLRPRSRRARRLHLRAGRDLGSAPSRACAKAPPNSTSSAACIPILPFDYFLELIRGLKQRCPARAPEGLHHGRGRTTSRASPSFPSTKRCAR